MAIIGTIANIIKESFQEISVIKIIPKRIVKICLRNSANVVLKVSVSKKYLKTPYFEALSTLFHQKI